MPLSCCASCVAIITKKDLPRPGPDGVDRKMSGVCRCKATTTARKRKSGGEVGVGEASFISRRRGLFNCTVRLKKYR